MGYKVKLVDCAANAFISKLEGTRDTFGFMSYSVLEDYGRKVVEDMRGRGLEAETTFSRDETDELFYRNEEFFSPATLGGENGIALKAGTTKSMLIHEFRGYLPLDLLLSYCSVGHDLFGHEK